MCVDVCRIFEQGSVQLHLVSEAAIVKLKYGFLTIGKKKDKEKAPARALSIQIIYASTCKGIMLLEMVLHTHS